jgi:hypothetical protein
MSPDLACECERRCDCVKNGEAFWGWRRTLIYNVEDNSSGQCRTIITRRFLTDYNSRDSSRRFHTAIIRVILNLVTDKINHQHGTTSSKICFYT